MAKIVECVPNFSEARPARGRRPDPIGHRGDRGRHLSRSTLRHRSQSHGAHLRRRTGTRGASRLRAIKTAAELIDLDQHTGEHPRIGATDVVPFVPVSGVTLEECVAHGQARGRTRRQRVEHSRLSLRSGGHPPRSREPGKHPARPVRRLEGRDRIESRSGARLRPGEIRPGRCDRHRRAIVPRSPSTSISTRAMSKSPRRSPKPCGIPAAACVTSKRLASSSRDRRRSR